MTHVFYAFTFFVILYEISVLQSPNKFQVFVSNFKRKLKDKEEIDGKDYAFALFNLTYLFWAWVGIFSSQWHLFVILIIIGLIPGKFTWVIFTNALVSLIIVLAIVVSKYHYPISLI